MLKVNDFFCGAGGFGLGFKQAGFHLAGAWDFDRHAVTTYRFNVSPNVELMDISYMTHEDVPSANVWTFGFPCTDISVAGKQAGMVKGQTRSGMFFEIMRLLDEVIIHGPEKIPSIILAENVKAVKNYLPLIETEYNLRGYHMYSVLYDSKYWGVPHGRQRYFIIGVHESIGTSFEFRTQLESFTPKLSSILEDDVPFKYFVDEEKAKLVIADAEKRTKLTGVHACVTPNTVNKNRNGRRAKGEDEDMFTLTTYDRHGIIYGDKVRVITPRECARLQSFPDSFEQLVTDNQFYVQMGNAVTVNIAKAIAEDIAQFLNEHYT